MKEWKFQRKKLKLQKNTLVWGYLLPSKEIGIAFQKINRRAPDEGFYRNKICREWRFVVNGKGTPAINQNKILLKKGTVFYISPKKKSYIIGRKLELITITKPDFYNKQREIVF